MSQESLLVCENQVLQKTKLKKRRFNNLRTAVQALTNMGDFDLGPYSQRRSDASQGAPNLTQTILARSDSA